VFLILVVDVGGDLLEEEVPDGCVCDGEEAQSRPVGCFIFHTISIKGIR